MKHHTLSHSSNVAAQFRELATWIDQHGITPWHIELDLGYNRLVAHLDNSLFLELFPESTPTVDSIGVTWKSTYNNIQFQSFSTHKRLQDSEQSPSEPSTSTPNHQHTTLRDSA